MTEKNKDRKRTNSRITYAATSEGIERAELALRRRGVASKRSFAELCNLSPSTINKFFRGEPIQQPGFITIFKALELSGNWKEIADIENSNNNGKVIPEINFCNLTTEKEKVTFTITGSVDKKDIAKLKSIIQLARKLAKDDLIDVIDIEEGSIKLTLKGSPEGLQRLEQLFQSGELSQIFEQELNITVEDVRFISIHDSDGNRKKNTTTEEIQLAFTIAGDVKQAGIDILKAALIDTSDNDAQIQSDKKSRLIENINKKSIANQSLVLADLSNTKLSGIHFGFADLRSINLSGSGLTDANLSCANLAGANMNRVNLKRANLNGANLERTDLSNAILSEAKLINTNLSYAIFNNTDLSGADLSGADLSDANISNTYLKNTIINENTLLNDIWRLLWEIVNQGGIGIDLSHKNLRRANLNDVVLRRANLRGVNFNNANLNRADLSSTNLNYSNLSNAHLKFSDLSYANLKFSDLRKADLRGANLKFADLKNSDLTDTNLSDATVTNAIFGRNIGITKLTKLHLISKGAIFEDSQGDPSRVLTPV